MSFLAPIAAVATIVGAGASIVGAIGESRARKDQARAESAALEQNASISLQDAEAAIDEAELAAEIERENAFFILQDGEMQALLLEEDAKLARDAAELDVQDIMLSTKRTLSNDIARIGASGIDVKSASSINFLVEQANVAEEDIRRVRLRGEIAAIARENEASQVRYRATVGARGAENVALQHLQRGDIAARGALSRRNQLLDTASSVRRAGERSARTALIKGIGGSLLTFGRSEVGQDLLGSIGRGGGGGASRVTLGPTRTIQAPPPLVDFT